jgi:nucleoside-diphosphate-sugar epimerase
MATTNIQASAKPVVVITGSSGLIGSKLVAAFASNYDVVGLDRDRPKEMVAGTDFIECDLTKDDSVAAAFGAVREKHGNRLTSVIHLAAYYDFSGEPSEMYRQLTVEGTARVLREIKEFETEQFVFSSTILVMEPAEEGEAITEASPLEDEPWDYPRSKIEAEKLILRERGNISAVILRIAGVYNEEGHAVPIAQQISRIYERQLESYFFPGDASHGQAFVHLDDLVECFKQVIALRRELGPADVFLIAEPEVMSYAELQEQLGELIHGEQWPTIRIPKAVAKAGAWVQEKISGEEATFIKPWMIDLADDHYPVEIARARERLGWEPQHRLRDALSHMVGRLKENPRAWYEMHHLTPPEDEKEKRELSAEEKEVSSQKVKEAGGR